MRDVIRRLEDLETGRAREQEELEAQRAEPKGCPEGLSPGEMVDWWLGLPSCHQRQIELRAMIDEHFQGFLDALAERYPEHAARFNRDRKERAAGSPVGQ